MTTAGKRVLVLSSVRWDYLWQRQQALATAAAEDGWAVDFLPPHPRNVRQVVHFLFQALRRGSPAGSATPVPPPPGVTVLPMRRWLFRPARYHLVLLYIPDRWAEVMARLSGASAVIYDAVLDWEKVPQTWYPPIGWRAAEQRLGRSRKVQCTTDSPGMQAVLISRGIHAQVVLPAADEAFRRLQDQQFDVTPRSVVYFGAVRDEVNTDVLIALSAAGFTVTVIGTVDSEAQRTLLKRSGIELLPQMGTAELALAVVRHEFVLLPYRGERSGSIVPAKLWNCLATGRWVLASGLNLQVEAANLVHTGSDPREVVATARRLATTAPEGRSAPPVWATRWQEILDRVPVE